MRSHENSPDAPHVTACGAENGLRGSGARSAIAPAIHLRLRRQPIPAPDANTHAIY